PCTIRLEHMLPAGAGVRHLFDDLIDELFRYRQMVPAESLLDPVSQILLYFRRERRAVGWGAQILRDVVCPRSAARKFPSIFTHCRAPRLSAKPPHRSMLDVRPRRLVSRKPLPTRCYGAPARSR